MALNRPVFSDGKLSRLEMEGAVLRTVFPVHGKHALNITFHFTERVP